MASDVLDAAELVSALYRLQTGDDVEARLYQWVEDVTHRRPVFIRFTAASRASVLTAIFRTELQVLDLTVTKLRADVAALRPYEWESAEVRAAKLQMVREEEAWLAHTAAVAREEVRSAASVQAVAVDDGGAGSFRYTPGPAFHQLVHVAVNGW